MSAPTDDPPDPPLPGELVDTEMETETVNNSAARGAELEETVENTENTERALVLANTDETEQRTFADAAASAGTDSEVKDILRIVLKKTDKSANFFVSDKQKGYLVFKLLDIPKEKVVGIDQEDFRTIRVHLNTWSEPYKVAYSVQVKDGLVTLPMRMFRRNTRVRIQRAGIGTDKDEITEMLSHFGTIEEDVHWCNYFEDHPHPNTLSEEEQMMRGIRSGDATVRMFISKPIPNFCLLSSGRKVRVRYNAQPVNCARCFQGIRGCRGNGNAAKCEKAGGKAVPLAEFWKIITAEAEEQRAQRGDGEETSEIPGNILLVEGLGKEAGIEWLKQFLSSGSLMRSMEAALDTCKVRRSKDKKTFEITGLSPVDIRGILEGCSGTQYRGRTVYCTPVVASGNSLFESESESGQSDAEEDKEKENDDDEKESGDENENGNDDDVLPMASATPPKDKEGFQAVETKSQEKKRKKEEKAARDKADKAAELANAKELGIVDKNGEHKTPPRGKAKDKASKSKRKVGDANLTSPPGAPPRARSTRRDKKNPAESPPNPTSTVQAGSGQ